MAKIKIRRIEPKNFKLQKFYKMNIDTSVLLFTFFNKQLPDKKVYNTYII